MSECVVRMEIPKNGCSECRLKYKKRGYGGVFYCFNHLCVDKWTYGRTQNGDRPSWCPIICQLPEGHGRLVDENEVKDWVENLLYVNKYYHPYSSSKSIHVSDLYDVLQRMDAAVPAERSET